MESAREGFEKELWNKVSSISQLSDEVENLRSNLARKTDESAKMASEVGRPRSLGGRLESEERSSSRNARRRPPERWREAVEVSGADERHGGSDCGTEDKLGEKESEVASLRVERTEMEGSLRTTHENLLLSEGESKKTVSELQQALNARQGEHRTDKKELEERIQELENEKSDEIARRVGELASQKRAFDSKFEQRLEETRKLSTEVSRLSGALEFAQKELADKDQTIRSLSEVLEEKKNASAALERELARVRSESVDKLTEIVRQSEQTMESRSTVEKELRDTLSKLRRKEEETSALSERNRIMEGEKNALEEELTSVKLSLEVLQKEKEAGSVTVENLQGMVASLSQAKETLSTDCFEQLAEQRKVTEEKVVQIGELQRKLKNAKQQLTAVKKEGDESRAEQERLRFAVVAIMMLCKHTHKHAHTQTCTHTHTHTHNTGQYTYVRTYTFINMHLNASVHTNTCTHVQTHTHTHTHIHMYVHMHVKGLNLCALKTRTDR